MSEWKTIVNDVDENALRSHLGNREGIAVAIDGSKKMTIIESYLAGGYMSDEDKFYSGYLRNWGFWAYILIPEPTPSEDYFFIDGELLSLDRLVDSEDGVSDMAKEIIRLREELGKLKGDSK